jgi:hypothetical protein
MASTANVLARLRHLARPMNSDLPPVDDVLPLVKHLLDEAGVRFKFVGGIAVVHHGYARTTEDIDVLVERGASARLGEWLARHGFERVSDVRLRHVLTGVRVDLLVAGSPMPRVGSGVYPSPETLVGSESDRDVVGLSGLFELKLLSHRHRDVADVVELLKRLDEARYIETEAAMSAVLRPRLATLRRDALEELAGE